MSNNGELSLTEVGADLIGLKSSHRMDIEHQPIVCDTGEGVFNRHRAEFIAELGVHLLKLAWALPEGRSAVLEAVPPDLIKSIAAVIHSRLRKRRGGAAAVLRKCPFCTIEYGAREMRRHKPRCPASPRSSRDS